jgi:hypothetical protein
MNKHLLLFTSTAFPTNKIYQATKAAMAAVLFLIAGEY